MVFLFSISFYTVSNIPKYLMSPPTACSPLLDMSVEEPLESSESSCGSIADSWVPHVPPDSPAMHHVRVGPQHTGRPKTHNPESKGVDML